MPLTLQSPATLSQTLVSIPQLQTFTAQRPKLKMVWHKEWDGKRERMVAYWMIDQ
jgi:hypothetical protein